LEQVFAQELLADPDSAERWVTKTDQADLPSRLLQWAQAVAAGTHRTEAPYWFNASPAYTRWLDSRDSPATSPTRATVEVSAVGHQEADPRARIERLESMLRETISLVLDLASVMAVTPGRYSRHQREAEALRSRAADLDG
jgi:hypothetical protein